MVVWNQVKFVVTSSTKLVYDVIKKQSSDVISLSRLQNMMCAPRISPNNSILTPGQTVLAMTLQHQTAGWVGTRVPMLETLTLLGQATR